MFYRFLTMNKVVYNSCTIPEVKLDAVKNDAWRRSAADAADDVISACVCQRRRVTMTQRAT